MTGIVDFSLQIRILAGLLILAAEVTNIWNIVYAVRTKKRLYVRLSILLFAAAYFMQEMFINVTEYKIASGYANMHFLELPISGKLLMTLVILEVILSALMVYCNFYYRRTNLTPNVIKDCADQMEIGICYYKDGGLVIFQNKEMNGLCLEILGKPLLNGEELQQAVASRTVRLKDGRVMKFEHRMKVINNINAHELLAFDITEFDAKSQTLARENEELNRLNESLHEYNLRIDDTVRREEILLAKISIHDEMNRLMLLTGALQNEGSSLDTNQIMELWKKNALLLSREKENMPDSLKPIKELAELLDINLVFTGVDFDKLCDEHKKVVTILIKETLANASKHADARNMFIDINTDNNNVKVNIANDGKLPKCDIIPTGGLSNLSKVIKDFGGEISFKSDVYFNVIVRLCTKGD